MQVAAFTGDATVAEDVVQEAFARALVRWDQIAAYDDVEAWIRLVAFNLARSRWRRMVRGAAALRRMNGRQPVVHLSDDHLVLLHSLRKLKEVEREVIVLHHLLDLPIREVASRLRLSESQVKLQLGYARSHLAKTMKLEGLE